MRTLNGYARQALLALAGAAFAVAGCANPVFKAGQQLSQEKVRELGELPVYKNGQSSYKVLPYKAEDGSTLVLTGRGSVVASRHEVVVASATEGQVQAAVLRGPRPASVQHFGPTGLTMVRYGDFGQAMQGLTALKAALPQASVRLALEGPKQEPQ